jgi:chromosome segregation ATPase
MDYDELVQRLRAAAATSEVDPDECSDAIVHLRARVDTWMLNCRNAERARDEADADRNRLEADLAAAQHDIERHVAITSEQATEMERLRADLAAARQHAHSQDVGRLDG